MENIEFNHIDIDTSSTLTWFINKKASEHKLESKYFNIQLWLCLLDAEHVERPNLPQRNLCMTSSRLLYVELRDVCRVYLGTQLTLKQKNQTNAIMRSELSWRCCGGSRGIDPLDDYLEDEDVDKNIEEDDLDDCLGHNDLEN